MDQKRVELSTGIFVKPEDWDEVVQGIVLDYQGAEVYNQQLQKTRTDINDIYNRLISQGNPFDINDIKNMYLGNDISMGLLAIFDYYLKTMEANLGRGYAYGTLRHYRVTYKMLKSFIKIKFSKKDIPVSEVKYDFLNKFDMYLKSEKGMKQNTVWNYHKHLKRVINVAISLDEITINPYRKFKMLREEYHR